MNSWRGWGNDEACLQAFTPSVCSFHSQPASPRGRLIAVPQTLPSAQKPSPWGRWHRVSDDGRGKLSSQKQKSGHSGGQAECPVFVFFASAVVPNTAGAAPEVAEQTVLPLPVEKRKEWRNGAERLQTLLFSGATWLELANHRCENRIPQTVSLVNPQFANFFAKLPRRRGFGVFSTFCPKNSLSAGRKPTCFLLLFKTVLAIIVTQDFVDRFLFSSTPCIQSCRSRQFKTVSPPESRL